MRYELKHLKRSKVNVKETKCCRLRRPELSIQATASLQKVHIIDTLSLWHEYLAILLLGPRTVKKSESPKLEAQIQNEVDRTLHIL